MRSTLLTAVLFAAAAALLAALRAPSDSDMWWHLASGDWTLDHGRILDRDIYSFTRSGTPYDSAQWLGQVVLAIAHRAGGWVGIDLLRGALVGVSAFFVARATLRVQPHVGWATPAIVATLLVSSTRWSDRPQLFTLAFAPFVLDTLLAARLEARTRRLAILPPLFLLWANLHAGFVVGLAMAGIVAAEALVSRAPQARVLSLAFIASAVASQLNPAVFGAIGYAFSYTSTPWPFIVEELPTNVRSPVGLILAVLLFGALGSAVLLGRDAIRDRIGPPLLWAALLIPFAFLGLAVQRHVSLACAVLAPFASAAIPAALGRPPTTAPSLPRGPTLAISAFISLAVATVAVSGAPRAPDLDAYPAAALPALAAARGNLLNEYDWGGYLIHEAPQHPTFVDGRGALLFVPDVLEDFGRAVHVRPGYDETLRRWDIALVLLRPERPLVGVLRRDGWRVLGEETDRWVLLARP